MNIVPIVFAFDSNLLYPAHICISSLLTSAKSDTFYDIYILYSTKSGLTDNSLCKILNYYSNCRIQYRLVDNSFDSSFEIRGITTPAYYRLLIPELIPEYDKIIYSDVDVIFRSDMFEIYDSIDLENYYLAGVNSLSHLIPENVKYYEKMGLDAHNIIYSGNLIFNSKKLREEDIVKKFKAMSKNKYKFQDMDILNLVCKDKIKYISPVFCLTTYISEWNVYNKDVLFEFWDELTISKALSEGIIHYNGQKPWKGLCVNFDIWWEYYRKSPFFDEKFYFDFFYHKLNELDGLSLLKRIKILVRYFVFGRKKY